VNVGPGVNVLSSSSPAGCGGVLLLSVGFEDVVGGPLRGGAEDALGVADALGFAFGFVVLSSSSPCDRSEDAESPGMGGGAHPIEIAIPPTVMKTVRIANRVIFMS
jgi:hypothetical protein